jgi:uncharacterized SAM-binding protein YcdF (DUF218 family)
MFIFLSKFIPLLVYPMGAAAFLLALGWLFWNKRRFARWMVIMAFLLLFAGGNRYVAYSLARSLEWRYLPQGDPPAADVIVILGGATEPQNAPRPTVELNAAADRLFYGAELYKQNKSPRVLLSGGDIEFLSTGVQSPAQDMSEVMQMLGVPQSAIIIQGKSQNTHEDAVYSCAWIKENKLQTVLLVTSATHMPRSVMLFEKEGCAVIPAPADFTVTQTAWQRLWHPNFEEFMINLIPNYSNLSLLTKSLKEYIGIGVYKLQGWH